MGSEPTISGVRATAFTIPTDAPEADGTFAWSETTIVIVEIDAADQTGLGYTYAHACICDLIERSFEPLLVSCEPLDIPGAWIALQRHVRNLGRSGLCACAISAIDTALWDLKSKLLGLPLVRLLGAARDDVPVYGSGGFTTYTDAELRNQLAGWIDQGCRWVKMKIGSDPARDPHRIEVARSAIGVSPLFIDANGAFDVSEALGLARACRVNGITWFEEPVTSDDLAGLHMVREGAPPGMEIAAGEYIFTLDDARHLLEAGAVDVLQADVTRCGGVTGFLAVADLCDAHHIDLSAHCAPALHRHVACAARRLRHVEWFHDHVRIEQMLFDGAPRLKNGLMHPDLREPGHGLRFKRQDAERYRIGAAA